MKRIGRREDSDRSAVAFLQPDIERTSEQENEQESERSGAGVIYAKSLILAKRGPACTLSSSHLGVRMFLRGLGSIDRPVCPIAA